MRKVSFETHVDTENHILNIIKKEIPKIVRDNFRVNKSETYDLFSNKKTITIHFTPKDQSISNDIIEVITQTVETIQERVSEYTFTNIMIG